MTLTLFATAVFVLLAAGSESVLRHFETRPQVTAFFADETTESQIEDLKTKLEATGKVSAVKFVSQEEALSIYREQNKDDPLLLEMVTANILPASLEVSTQDLAHLGEIADILKQESVVEEVIFQEEVVESLRQVTNNIRRVGAGLIVFLAVVSLLIIFIIIGMKIALRRDEIKILRLIGASPWYVWAPFIFEGMFYGLFGALIAWGITFLLLLYSTPLLVDFLKGILILPISHIFMLGLLGAGLLMGVLIGVLASLIAVKRYLR
jgi:cell division transport system permease protein